MASERPSSAATAAIALHPGAHSADVDSEIYLFAGNLIQAILARLEAEHADAEHRWHALNQIEGATRARHFRRAIEYVVREARSEGIAVWSAAL